MICTDLGSRGLDFKNNGFVVNFDFPGNAADYLHRVGRTGRAGRPGTAFSLIRKKNMKVVNSIKESFEKGIPLLIGNSSYTKKNKELLNQLKKLENDQNPDMERREQIGLLEQKLELQGSLPDSYVQFRGEALAEARQNGKLKGGKRRPETREKKALKRLKKEKKKIPKQERHQLTRIMGKMKKRGKKLTKIVNQQKEDGWN